jgi:signal transduction histidine kinase
MRYERRCSILFNVDLKIERLGTGTGLGLSVSYGIVQTHGGTIEASSKVNEGTCITVRLPVVAQRPAPSSARA